MIPLARRPLVAPDPRLPDGRRARVVVSLSKHRATLYDGAGRPMRDILVRTGTSAWPDGRGSATNPGVRVVSAKVADPSADARRLWPGSGGRAFGDRLLDLTPVSGPDDGQELHGVDDASTLGRDASHGCVGMRNADIRAVFDAVAPGDLVRFDP